MLVTAGCGISQKSFERWKTWPWFCDMTHMGNHVNVGVPAAGNNIIRRTIVKQMLMNHVKVGIVTWTSIGKLDLHIEQEHIGKEIKTYNLRNFLVDLTGEVQTGNTGYWPSSVGVDNRIKAWYSTNLRSKFNDYYEFLENILITQTIAEKQNTKLYMFISYKVDFDYIKSNDELSLIYNNINWNDFVTLDILGDNYENSEWKKYSTDQEYGLVPVIGWHWDFYEQYIMPILNKHYNTKKSDINKLRNSCYTLTEKYFKDGVS